MDISDILQENHICANLQGSTKFQVIEELLDLLHHNKRLINREVALNDILAREGHLSTGLENGLAIPHAKTDGVAGLDIAFGLKRDGVDFESLDHKPANFIFLVVSPRDTAGPHIKALADISRHLKEISTRKALAKSQDAAEIARIFRGSFSS